MSELDFGPKAGIPGVGEAADGLPIRSPISDPSSTAPGEEEFDRSLRPRTLDDFVGQPRVREQLGVFIDAAKARDEALDHALFAGPPGLGKCVTPDTLLMTPQGMLPISELGELGGDSWQPITRPVAGLYGTRVADWFYDNGQSDTIRISTRAGYRVEGTPNHPLLVQNGMGDLEFRRMDALRHGDSVAVRIGAQVFGSSTRLAVEGIGAPTLADPAVVPDTLTVEFAKLLGVLMSCGRLSPKGDGIVIVSSNDRRIEDARELLRDVCCVELDSFGDGPFGQRFGQRAPRLARMLVGLGLTRQGFDRIPAAIYRAPRLQVAGFMQGLFSGAEHAPVVHHAKRDVVAHLQLMLANLGIESVIAPAEQGYALRVSTEPTRYDEVDQDRLSRLEQPTDHDHHSPPSTTTPSSGGAISTTGSAATQAVGFGMTPAGVLIALDQSSAVDTAGGYRRGQSVSSEIFPVDVTTGPNVRVEPATIAVAQVDPIERPAAVTRGRMHHDVRALAVRSVPSQLEPDAIVELIWEPITSIEPGHGWTCDVSVPDGHTFIGNGIVCHNTTLASVVANELGSTMHVTSGPALEKKADVAAILTSLGPRDVLFIDEIHRMSSAIEEVLYSAMEDYQIDLVLGQGPAARTIRLDVEPFTLVGATTRTGLLTTPLRDRFGMTQRLEYYSSDELTQIVNRSARLMEIPIDDDAAHEIATRSRGTPRIANRLLRRVRDVAQVRHEGHVTVDVAREALDLVDIDAAGLDRMDRRILEAILTRFAGGPVGLGTLAVAIGEEPHTIEDVYEPFLIQRGLIQRTPRGRVITPRGREHIGAAAAGTVADGPALF